MEHYNRPEGKTIQTPFKPGYGLIAMKWFIRYDNRLGVHGPTTKLAGKPHNHGGGLRINPKNVHQLFNVNIDL